MRAGWAFRFFLRKLIQQSDLAKAEIKLLMQQFYEFLPLGEDDGWERRFAQKFALAAAAGILAVRWDLLPWTEDHVLNAVKRSYRRSRKALPEAEVIIKRGLIALDAFIADRTKVVDLRELSSAQRKILKRVPGQGYLREWRDYGLHLVVKQQVFRSWFKEPRDADLLLHELDRLGRIKRDPKRNIVTRQVKLWAGDKAKQRYLIIAMREPNPEE